MPEIPIAEMARWHALAQDVVMWALQSNRVTAVSRFTDHTGTLSAGTLSISL